MHLHRFATIGHGAECSHEERTLLRYGKFLRIGNQRELALRLQCRSIDKLHRIVLVTLVPQAYTTVLTGAAPEVHRDARVALGLNLIVVAVRSNGKRAHARCHSRSLHHLVLGSRGHVERIALLVGQLVAVGTAARHLPQLRRLAHSRRGGHIDTRCLGRDGIAAVNELDEIPHRVLRCAHRREALRQSAQSACHEGKHRKKISFHRFVFYCIDYQYYSGRGHKRPQTMAL